MKTLLLTSGQIWISNKAVAAHPLKPSLSHIRAGLIQVLQSPQKKNPREEAINEKVSKEPCFPFAPAPPKVANGRSHTIIMQVKRLSGWSFFLLPFDAMLWGTMDWKPALLLENLTVVQYAAAACFSSVVWRHNILWLPPLESLGNY